MNKSFNAIMREYALPCLTTLGIVSGGCHSKALENKRELEHDCLLYYDLVLGPSGLADRNHDGALDLEEQGKLMRLLGIEELMEGNNFPEVLRNRENFRRHLRQTWYLGEIHDKLNQAYLVYIKEEEKREK